VSISGISPASNADAAWTSRIDASGQRRADFQALAQALQGGNLQGAQQAFSALQQDTKSAPRTGQAQGNAGTSDLAALGQALRSGDLSGAQNAFASLQQDIAKLQASRHHHHRHHAHGAAQVGSSAGGAVLGNTSPGGTGLNVRV
jgi:hypothetical protein